MKNEKLLSGENLNMEYKREHYGSDFLRGRDIV
jgi:hypothetical protein